MASVFDFPLHATINRVFAGQGVASDLASLLGRDGVYTRPDLLTTLLDNHDTPRLAAVPGVTPARLRLAVAFLLTTRGTPQLTWGDEVGLLGQMDDRCDFPGGWPGDPRDLLHLRRETPALRRGTLTNLVADQSTSVYRRDHAGQTALVALNLGDKPAAVKLPADCAGLVLDRVPGPGAWDADLGAPRLALPPESATIFRRKVASDPVAPDGLAPGRH